MYTILFVISIMVFILKPCHQLVRISIHLANTSLHQEKYNGGRGYIILSICRSSYMCMYDMNFLGANLLPGTSSHSSTEETRYNMYIFNIYEVPIIN